MDQINRRRIRALVTFSLILGGAGGTFLYVTSSVWALLWGVSASEEPLKWLALSSFVSPLTGLATGLMARQGKFRRLAIITFIGNLVGIVFGVGAVLVWRSPSSLLVSTIVPQVLLLLGCLFSTDGHLLGLARLGHARGDLSYSGKVVATNMSFYLSGNIVKWSMPRAISPASLGHWNRAETVTLVPLQQLQGAMTSAVFPEFRHDVKDSSRARIVWTDMLIATSWPSLILGCCGAILIPVLLPFMFGDRWADAALVAGPLALAGGVQLLASLLTSAISALGIFRWLWATEAALVALQLVTAIGLFAMHEILLAAISLVVTTAIRHFSHVWLANRRGYLMARRLLAGYLRSSLFSTLLAILCFVEVQLVRHAGQQPIAAGSACAIPIAVVAVLYVVRNQLPPVIIARNYGLLRK